MKKFSYILESKSDTKTDIEEIFVDFTDNGFTLKVDSFQGFYDIVLKIDKPLNWMECIQNLSDINDKLLTIGLKFVHSSKILLNDSEGYLKFKYRMDGNKISKDVNGFGEFKAYCENVLGIYGIQGKQLSNDNHWFRINVVSEQGFRNEEYFGWELSKAESVSDEDFIKEYPGYESFLKNLLSRKINWVGVWDNKIDGKQNNPMNFDKEGIEAVEKLLEMANKFPNKIEIVKP